MTDVDEFADMLVTSGQLDVYESVVSFLESTGIGYRALRDILDVKYGRAFICLDCGVDTNELGEYYMLRDTVWEQALPAVDGMLCIGCVEKRLGRELNGHDFIDAPINDDHVNMSPRLLNRLGVDKAGTVC